MRLCCGTTRLVLLFGPFAIKIARVRTIALIPALIRTLRRGDLEERVVMYGTHPMKVLWGVMMAGFYGNLQEYRLYRDHPEYPIAPVLRCYLRGFIIVMSRGQLQAEISKKLAAERKPVSRIGDDVFEKRHWYLIGGEPRLIDYGGPNAPQSLAACFVPSSEM